MFSTSETYLKSALLSLHILNLYYLAVEDVTNLEMIPLTILFALAPINMDYKEYFHFVVLNYLLVFQGAFLHTDLLYKLYLTVSRFLDSDWANLTVLWQNLPSLVL